MIDTLDKYLTVKEVAALLGITEPTVAHHIRSKNMQAVRVHGKCVLIKKSELERFQSSRR